MVNKKENRDLYSNIKDSIEKCSCVIGFDAFVDYLTRPVKEKDNGKTTYFDTLKEFAEFLLGKGEMSGSIEMTELARKYGGNNPIMSYALGKAGARVSSIGAYGVGQINPVFSELQKFCSLHTFTMPGECWAYEFDKNKIMNFINMKDSDFTYERISDMIGEEVLGRVIGQADLLVLVNYSEQTNVINIWKGILEKILPRTTAPKKFFFDLSDCTRIPDKNINDFFRIIPEFKKYGPVYLSLNENEFLKLYDLCSGVKNQIDFNDKHTVVDYAGRLRSCIGADCVFLRTLNYFYAVEDKSSETVPNLIEQNPLVLTGAGDNQNAGICLGLMCGLNLSQCLELGAIYGNYYIRHGESADLETITSLSCLI